MVKRPVHDPAVTRYFTRNFPVALLTRVRAWATVHDTTVEDAINKLVEIGLKHATEGGERMSIKVDDFEIAQEEIGCGKKSYDGFICTRVRDHEGDHVAMVEAYEPPCARWPQ